MTVFPKLKALPRFKLVTGSRTVWVVGLWYAERRVVMIFFSWRVQLNVRYRCVLSTIGLTLKYMVLYGVHIKKYAGFGGMDTGATSVCLFCVSYNMQKTMADNSMAVLSWKTDLYE